MNAVGADQDIAARGLDMIVVAIEEISGDAAFVLREVTESATSSCPFSPRTS